MKTFIVKRIAVQHITAKGLLFIIIFLIIMSFSWGRSYYLCDLTGRIRIVDRVFLVAVHTSNEENDMSICLDALIGPTKYRRWCLVSYRSVFGRTPYSFKPQSLCVYQAYISDQGFSKEKKEEMLETLREARQTIQKSTKDFKFEIEEKAE